MKPKVVILCGGKGTRLSEETIYKPKPMVEIGGIPILCHIMNIYSFHGYNEFVIALGYKGDVIKDYFLNYYYRNNDFTIDLKDGVVDITKNRGKNWIIHFVDTGLETMTGGRLLRLKRWLNEEKFMLTYGDGVGNININALLDFHQSHNKICTVTSVKPKGRFGTISFNGNVVEEFNEKSQSDENWINGGFFAFDPRVFGYIEGDETILEKHVLEKLVVEQQLMAYKHDGFWDCMDTLKDKQELDSLWKLGKAPWDFLSA